MECTGCGSAPVAERSERTAQGYRRFRSRACGKQFNERSAGSLNRTQYPSSLSESAILRKNMSPTAISGFLCYAQRRNLEINLRFVRALCLSPTGC
jgi:transposase-like protein